MSIPVQAPTFSGITPPFDPGGLAGAGSDNKATFKFEVTVGKPDGPQSKTLESKLDAAARALDASSAPPAVAEALKSVINEIKEALSDASSSTPKAQQAFKDVVSGVVDLVKDVASGRPADAARDAAKLVGSLVAAAGALSEDGGQPPQKAPDALAKLLDPKGDLSKVVEGLKQLAGADPDAGADTKQEVKKLLKEVIRDILEEKGGVGGAGGEGGHKHHGKHDAASASAPPALEELKEDLKRLGDHLERGNLPEATKALKDVVADLAAMANKPSPVAQPGQF